MPAEPRGVHSSARQGAIFIHPTSQLRARDVLPCIGLHRDHGKTHALQQPRGRLVLVKVRVRVRARARARARVRVRVRVRVRGRLVLQ